MQYYTFDLDDESQDYCVIATPFGLYRYLKMPMGISPASDISQHAMELALREVEEAHAYFDDVKCWDLDWPQHLVTLERTLSRLEAAGFSINPLKCEWGVQETDWLGYWVTPSGLKPWRKKVDAILKLAPPCTLKEVRSFIGAVTFYRDMFPRRSHILAPLTDLMKSPKSKFVHWTNEHQKAFEEMKALITQDVMIRYPDHNLPYHIYTDASEFQMGSVIMQEGAPVAYFSRKLNAAQRNYSTIEKELLSIVETLKEYRTMLFGCRELHIYTDHKNLTYNKLVSQKIMRWRLFIEEFHPTFHYVQGSENVIADALSRLPSLEGQNMVVQPSSPGDMKKPLAPTPVEVSACPHHSHFSCWSHSGYSSSANAQDETF